VPVIRILALAFALVICSLLAFSPAHTQISIGISLDIEPPPLPVYDQPPIPAPGYLWVPGYWAWDDDSGYYWVPGTWVLPPEAELLWTPGYWGWSDGVYVFHEGYWGPQIGFYGGVAYGFGYTGVGYEGGYWRDGAFFYNQSVNNISNVSITNVYNKTVIVNNTTNVSYHGGAGGTTVQPTPQQVAAANERHVPPTAAQTQNVQAAAKDPALSLNKNQGHPTVAATTQPAQFKGPGVIAAHPGKPVAAIAPQGHAVSSPGKAATIPASKASPAAPAPGNSGAAPGIRVAPAAATGQGNGIGPGSAAVTSNKQSSPEIKEDKGAIRGGQTSSPNPTPSPKQPPTAAHPTTPEAVRPTSPSASPPHAAAPAPPPPHAAPPPPPHAAAPAPPPPHAAPPPPPQAAAPLPPPHAAPPQPPPHAAPPQPPPQAAATTPLRPAPPAPRPAAPTAKPNCQPGQQC
jgi:hypothetical protein